MEVQGDAKTNVFGTATVSIYLQGIPNLMIHFVLF